MRRYKRSIEIFAAPGFRLKLRIKVRMLRLCSILALAHSTSNGIEINHMRFLTDVSIRVAHMTNASTDPVWRIKIFKGSTITWPGSGE